MADSFLRRWFGAKAPPPTVTEAQAELDRALADRPALAPVLGWLRELLPDLAPEEAAPPLLSAEAAREKLAAGVPLLRGLKVGLDERAFTRRWKRTCEVLEKHQPDGAAEALAEALRRGSLTSGEMLAAVLEGRPEDVRARAEALGLAPALATTVLRFALFPMFVPLEQALAPVRAGAAWGQGHCPTCGSWPILAELRGLDLSRHLRCGLCAASWEAERLWCPLCGCRDHEKLATLHGEGEELKYRSSTCDECRGQVKTLTTLSALPPLLLLVADAVTLHLDLAAAERGYLGPG